MGGYQVNPLVRMRCSFQFAAVVVSVVAIGVQGCSSPQPVATDSQATQGASPVSASPAAESGQSAENESAKGSAEMPAKGAKPDAIIKLRPGSSNLSPEMRLRLQRVADSIAGDERASIRLVGYVPEGGSSAWNIGEAERPLRAVKQYLETLRVPARRIHTASFGDEHKSVTRRNREWVEVFVLRPAPPISVR